MAGKNYFGSKGSSGKQTLIGPQTNGKASAPSPKMKAGKTKAPRGYSK